MFFCYRTLTILNLLWSIFICFFFHPPCFASMKQRVLFHLFYMFWLRLSFLCVHFWVFSNQPGLDSRRQRDKQPAQLPTWKQSFYIKIRYPAMAFLNIQWWLWHNHHWVLGKVRLGESTWHPTFTKTSHFQLSLISHLAATLEDPPSCIPWQ